MSEKSKQAFEELRQQRETASKVPAVPAPITGRVPALPAGMPGLTDMMGNASPNRGLAITFDKGRLPGGDGNDIALGTEAIVQGFAESKVVFKDGYVIATYVKLPGQPLPGDEELLVQHDLEDKSRWKLIGKDPVSPVRHNRHLYLRLLPTYELATFTVGSFFGKKAIETLGQQIYQDSAELPPGCKPVIKLDSGFAHSQAYGKVPCPKFAIARWLGPNGKEVNALASDKDAFPDDPIPPL